MKDLLDAVVRAHFEGEDIPLETMTSLLRDHVAIAAARHGPWLEPATFARHALEHVAGRERTVSGVIARLCTLHSADLYLALAAAEGVAAALEHLEAEHVRALRLWPERLREYSGRSSLRDWARVTIAREKHARRRITSPSCTGPSSLRRLRRAARPSGSSSAR